MANEMEPVSKSNSSLGCWFKDAFKGWNPIPNLNPRIILDEFNKNDVIQMLLRGGITLQHQTWERTSENGQKALAIMQRALTALGLLQINKDHGCNLTDFEFGVYENRTAEAVRNLQAIAGVFVQNPKFIGMYLGIGTAKAIKIALEALANSKDWRQSFPE